MFTSLSAVPAAAGPGFKLTAGDDGSSVGFSRGNYGVIVPDDALVDGNAISGVNQATSITDLKFLLAGNGLDQLGTFNRIAVAGVFSHGLDTIVLLAADATYNGNVFTDSRWTWNGLPGLMLDTVVYDVSVSQ